MYGTKPFSRNQRLEVEIMSIISEAILSNINIPKDILITVSEVKLARDLKIAKIFFSCLSSEKELNVDNITRLLESEKKTIRYYLGTQLQSKYVPDIRFFFDNSYKEFDKINRLVKNIK